MLNKSQRKLSTFRQLVFLHASDTDGRSLLGRFQTKAQDLEVDDHEVKVSLVKAIVIMYA